MPFFQDGTVWFLPTSNQMHTLMVPSAITSKVDSVYIVGTISCDNSSSFAVIGPHFFRDCNNTERATTL